MAISPELESKILRQIEYYFGDHNLSRDKFMQEEIKKDEGWIPLAVMLKFNRLAQISKDEEVIIGAVAKCTSGLLEVHEDKTKIRRNPERKIPEWDSTWKEDVQSRTLYMKGFPVDAVLDDIMPFVDKVCQTDNVFMRRLRNGTFKGSIFVTYKSADDCKKVMESESKKFKEDDADPLIFKFQKDYQTEKALEQKERKNSGHPKETSDVKSENEGKELKHKDAVLKIEGVEIEGLSIDDVKATFQDVEKDIAWVTFKKGDTTIKIRFNGDGSAAEVIKALEGKITIKEKKFELQLLEGEEEAEYWEEFRRDSAFKKKDKFGKKGGFGGGRGGGGGRGRGGGRGGRGGGGGGYHKRSGGGGRDEDEPAVKKPKSEDRDEPVVKKVKPIEGE